MASPPFPAEDQTDEDFFDKLVDDDFGIAKPAGALVDSIESDEANAFANLNVGDMCTVIEDSGDSGLNSENKERLVTSVVQNPTKDIMVSEESVSLVSSNSFSFDTVIESVDSVPSKDAVTEPLDCVSSTDPALDSTTGKNESKAMSIKEVQWSAFNADLTSQNMSSFGSFSEFFTELTDGSEDPFAGIEDHGKQETVSLINSSLVQKPVADSLASGGSFNGCLDNQPCINDQQTDGIDLNSSNYRENLYPGWDYDPSTGEWKKLDGYNASFNAQTGFEGMAMPVIDNIVSKQNFEVSHLQHTAEPVMGSIADYTANTSNWNQVYPANMVFDSQYPGWYYDTITQQWYLLESYTQAIAASSVSVEQPIHDGAKSLDGNSILDKDNNLHNEYGQFEQLSSQWQQGHDQDGFRNENGIENTQPNMWQPKQFAQGGFIGQQTMNPCSSTSSLPKHSSMHHMSFNPVEAGSPFQQLNIGVNGFKSSNSSENFYKFHEPTAGQLQKTHFSPNNYDNRESLNHSLNSFQNGNESLLRFTCSSPAGRSSAGRPPHALVTFGFSGKLVVLKDSWSSYGPQDSVGGSVSIMSLTDIVMNKTDSASSGNDACNYFHSLCHQSFPGPLVGGNAASKEVHKWLDERITNCQPQNIDSRKGVLLWMLLSFLKIACQHYGKFRSTLGIESALKENDGPESALAKLFGSARQNNLMSGGCNAFSHCVQNLPTEAQIQATSIEIQNLLVCGKRKEAIQRAQEGQLWGPALVLAAQLGDTFYVDTVKQMAQHQFAPGSPLRTLCLLIAGQPGDVFSVDTSFYRGQSSGVNISQHEQLPNNAMLDDWVENLAIMTTNRIKGDELVITHLGDCLWKERGEVAAAHICYLVAEANFESYSDSARLCLIGGDHWKFPRTYASPDAIQRTEIYEYSKVLGNAQNILLPFQPYKLIYAHMLAEVGKISESLRYCQALLKILKNSARSPEVESWKLLLLSLEERIKTHQQGGYGTNLAPGKLVGKLFTTIDKSIHRMIGGGPAPAGPPFLENSFKSDEHDMNIMPPKVPGSQSTMTLSSMLASTEPITEWAGGSNRMIHNRSISEPDFGRNVKQVDPSTDAYSSDAHSKTSTVAPSRLGRLGSQLLQKTMGWVSKSRSDREAKLGEENKFYYDDKLKRWVEEGTEPLTEEPALPPPPTTAVFQNGRPDYRSDGGFQNQNLLADAGTEIRTPNPPEHSSGIPPRTPNPSEHSSGIPPIPSSTNQFSARGRFDVRSRYVDTFNKGGGTRTNLFQSPSVPATKPLGGGAKFFVPSPPSSSDQKMEGMEESSQEIDSSKEPRVPEDSSFSSPLPLPSSSLPRFPSAGNIAPLGDKVKGKAANGSFSSRSRAASWSGSYIAPSDTIASEIKAEEASSMQASYFMPSQSSMSPNNAILPAKDGNFGDDLHEVEL